MPLPEQESGEGDQGNENKPDLRSIVRKIFERTVDIAQNRNASDKVNRALDRASSDVSHEGNESINQAAKPLAASPEDGPPGPIRTFHPQKSAPNPKALPETWLANAPERTKPLAQSADNQ